MLWRLLLVLFAIMVMPMWCCEEKGSDCQRAQIKNHATHVSQGRFENAVILADRPVSLLLLEMQGSYSTLGTWHTVCFLST
jgi:hypothetical protein